MNYKSAISYIESLQSTNIKLGLKRISKACGLLGHPEQKFKSVVVAGTNGKGSTCAFLESILRHSGLKVGLYTSPHLNDIRERIQINRKMISKADFTRLVQLQRSCLIHQANRSPINRVATYFEFLTVMAFQYFAEQRVDIAVLEVGLGGRFDAVNIVTPAASVITRIGLDHQGYLGDTIEKIASEKAGIIKKGVPVITVDQDAWAMNVIRKAAEENSSMFHVVSSYEVKWKLGLLGNHQYENAALAIRTADVVAAELALPNFSKASFAATSLASTKWPGRLEIISKKPLVILDGAHNPNGAEALAKFLNENYKSRHKIIMIGIMADKDIEGILKPLVKVGDEFVITMSSISRSATPSLVASCWSLVTESDLLATNDQRPTTKIIEPLSVAIQKTLQSMSSDSALIITGSLYTVAEARNLLGRKFNNFN